MKSICINLCINVYYSDPRLANRRLESVKFLKHKPHNDSPMTGSQGKKKGKAVKLMHYKPGGEWGHNIKEKN